ncbi:MAG: dockerin type I repeat-containing protein [Ruminococcus sp.]|uniref:dockerin type I repeat-containing protein n=1 Tax=Ruminococcus sp. TaxID=41978 RepID=UPI001B0C8A49|nr:dockerin type I repeat-containing protein [Ruminococcus sp.]MBO7473584.1 dockerin type I repeat-containing protein [Ruminococcus sp.]
MLKRRIITLFTSLTLGLTSLTCAPVYVNAEGITSPTALSDEDRITDLSLIREMFDEYIEEKGLNITCAEPGKYSQYTDQIVIEFDLNEEDYIELLNYAADNNIDRNSFTYMAYSDGVLMTTTTTDPNRTTTTTTTAVNTSPVTAQPLMTDTSGRIIDADGNVIIVNGTSAVMSGTPKGTTTTIAGSGSFALLSSSYSINVGETGSISRCGMAYPDSWTVDNDDVISLDTTGLKFTGLSAGTATITYNSKGVLQTATVTVTNVTTTTTTSFTTSYTTTTAFIDYMTQVDYDKSPMKVGEVRRVEFSHPTGATTGGSVYSSSDLIEITYEDGNNYFDVKALKEGEASISVHARGCAFDPTVTIKVIASEPEITTSEEPEVWMYGTGVDHFHSVNTLPTKTIYDEGEEFDLSGLVINAYHSVMRHSNKGNSEYLKTDYVWEVEDISPEYITISSLTGKKYTADQFPTLIGGNAYTVKIGKRGSTAITLSVKGDEREKELYDFESFTFRIYINPADKHSEFIHIDNAEVETFGYGTTSHGFKLKGMEAFSIDMDAYMHAGYEIESDIREGDTVSGVLCINPENYYIYFGDLDIVKYSGEVGDANDDCSIDMADAVLIMQALANPNKYGIGGMDARCMTKRGFALADQNGDGITVLDAQLIQNKLLGLK